MAKHHLVVVGSIGSKRAYLDVPREEAVRRFTASEDGSWLTAAEIQDRIWEFDFDDEFWVYDAEKI